VRRIRFQSLQLRLAVRLAALYLAATAVAFGVLIYQAYDTASSLNDRELGQRAADLAAAVSRDGVGRAQLTLPASLAAAYAESSGNIYALRDFAGRLVAATPEEFGRQVAKWPPATDDASYFRLTSLGSAEYYGLSIAIDTAAGPVSVSVARAASANAIVESLLREFVFDVAWVSPLLMAATLAIAVLVVRNGLKPVREVSRAAAQIGPAATSVRLAANDLPAEIKPLVDAVNRALDRLEQGFAIQRQFTADAAHELRTPLAIVTGALEVMDNTEDTAKLRKDVGRMNRLVDQLLRVARLDSVALEFARVDLKEIAQDLVARIAPWAIAQNRTIALSAPDTPVWIWANTHAVEDALRNIAENAVINSPVGGEVTIIVNAQGRVSVADCGAGIRPEDRENIFNRFWRGRGATEQGAGLGLAIVKETMRAHGGSVEVADNAEGGAVFTLTFRRPPSAAVNEVANISAGVVQADKRM